MRLLPRAQARRHHRRDGPQPRRGLPAGPRVDGFGQSTFEGIVYGQILHPNRTPQINPETGKATAEMPAGLFTGEDAQDVAAYVASAVSKGGEDKGQLAAAGVKRSNEVAKAEAGKLAIPADPSGGLAYQFGSAEAPAGSLEIDSENKSSVDHNIALEGNGVNEDGPDRQGRRRLQGHRRRPARRVHVLLLRAGPPRGRHGGQAHRQVTAAPRARACLVGVVLLPRAVEEERQREHHQHDVERRPSSRPPAAGRRSG